MGCCVSVPSHDEASNKKEQAGLNLESRAPPPSAEEETVKEVLSETAKPRQEPIMLIGGDVKKQVEETKDLTKPVFSKIQENKSNHHHQNRREVVVEEESVKRQEVETNEENMSEVSEICSLTMSESVSTTTVRSVADGKDDGGEGEVRQQQRQRVSRSPAKLPASNRVAGKSPMRRSEQSPGKQSLNNGSVRLVHGSSRDECGQSTTVRRGGSMPERRRRDPGESSGRRSRSPATTRSATMNRSPSTRRTTQSPGRVRTDPNESGGRKMEGKWAINQNNNNNNNNNCSTNESLENPLVSLECFIFL